MASHDPRSSSTQSLVPDSSPEHTGRRTLLLIYIHGFMGDETSFQSFPAHVHNLVTITLADSHVVHTKIYPKYRSRHALEVARDDFSQWLAPHESPTTDVILLGHSMGGLLQADVALLFRHNIIGTINFDVPFLGMHPGVVKAGLGSIFKPAPKPEHQPIEPLGQTEGDSGRRPSRMNTLFNPKPSDPNYNPSFYNDIHLPVRKGWENTLHFFNKHSNGLIQASRNLVTSHLEFGGAMADYRALKDRYARIRALEVDDINKRMGANPGIRSPPRIRFVNYYTASTGRPKKPKSPSPSRPESRGSQHPVNQSDTVTSESQSALPSITSRSRSASPHISVEEHRGNEVIHKSPEEPLSATSAHNESLTESLSTETEPETPLPEIPPIPKEPEFVDLAQITDKSERKEAEKRHSQALKDYQRAVKQRNAVIKERRKIEEKREKQRQKDERQRQKQSSASTSVPTNHAEEDDHSHPNSSPNRSSLEDHFEGLELGVMGQNSHDKQSGPYGNYDFSHSTIMNAASPDDRSSITDSTAPSNSPTTALTTTSTNELPPPPPYQQEAPPQKKPKYKKFCMLPPKDASGNKDPTWIRVFMKDVDEVGAHCGLFFVSQTYEMLVGDVGGRIEEWVREEESNRLVREMSET